MFACIYCSEDKTLSVLGQKSKILIILGSWIVGEKVSMTWGKTVYDGTIVKIGGK
jgi:hypothetical protein